MRVQTLLKQVSARAAEHATEDQAGVADKPVQQEFELNMTEDAPTPDQLKNILDYAGPQQVGAIVKGAKDEADAMRKLRENPDYFQRPIVSDNLHKLLIMLINLQTVDWNNGRVVAGDNESEILKMLESLPKQ